MRRDELDELYQEAETRFRELRAAKRRRARHIKCKPGQHEMRIRDVIVGGISKRGLEKTIGRPLPDVGGWYGFQCGDCLVCGQWLILSYSGEGETPITKKAGKDLLG